MKYIKWLLVLVSIVIILIAVTEIISYLRNPESYMLGSEAMVSNGGLYYKSKFTFLIINSLHVLVSLLAIILLLKSKQTSSFVFGLLLVLVQVLFSAIIT